METPYVYIDYEKLIKNIEDMAKITKKNQATLKPHFKSHKTIEIAKEQIKRCATGITTSTLKETQVIVENGFKNITLAYPLIGENKTEQFKSLGKGVTLSTLVLDSEHGIELNKYFSEKEPCFVWLKVNTGLNRLGVFPSEIPCELAKLKKLIIVGL